jgi:hypothetical protein
MRWSNGKAAVERLFAAGHVERVSRCHQRQQQPLGGITTAQGAVELISSG